MAHSGTVSWDGGRGKELCSVSKDTSLDIWLLLCSNDFFKSPQFRPTASGKRDNSVLKQRLVQRVTCGMYSPWYNAHSATEESRKLKKWFQGISYTEGLAHHCISLLFYGSKTERQFHHLGDAGILMSICWHMELFSLCSCLVLGMAPGQSYPDAIPVLHWS